MIGLIARQCSISSATSRCWRPSIGPTECAAASPIEGRRVLRRLCRSTGPIRNSRHRQQRQHHGQRSFEHVVLQHLDCVPHSRLCDVRSILSAEPAVVATVSSRHIALYALRIFSSPTIRSGSRSRRLIPTSRATPTGRLRCDAHPDARHHRSAVGRAGRAPRRRTCSGCTR